MTMVCWLRYCPCAPSPALLYCCKLLPSPYAFAAPLHAPVICYFSSVFQHVFGASLDSLGPLLYSTLQTFPLSLSLSSCFPLAIQIFLSQTAPHSPVLVS